MRNHDSIEVEKSKSWTGRVWREKSKGEVGKSWLPFEATLKLPLLFPFPNLLKETSFRDSLPVDGFGVGSYPP